MFNVGSQEVLIILFVVLMLFGAKRVPEVARSVGNGMRDFRRAMKGIEDELRIHDDPVRPRPRTEPPRVPPVTGGELAAVGTPEPGSSAAPAGTVASTPKAVPRPPGPPSEGAPDSPSPSSEQPSSSEGQLS